MSGKKHVITKELKRVVVTGIGVISPIGNTLEAFRAGLWEGRCGIARIEHFDLTDYSATMAGCVKDYRPEEHFERKEAKRLDRSSQFALVAAREALAHSGLDLEAEDRNRVGCIIGSGIAGLQTIETEARKLVEQGPRRVGPLFIPMAIANMPAGNVSIALGTKGLCYATVTACASATDAIGQAFHAIRYGRQEVIFAGGCEASVTPLGIAGFQSMKALSTSQDPQRASIPFDKERDGFVMGEGAAVLVLEELGHALRRGARICAELVGYGQSSDAYHITAPETSGDGGARAMRYALDDAGLEPAAVDYINAHGTSTFYNDSVETLAVKRAFGERAGQVAISSTKAMTGHLLGAAGAVEAVACLLAISDGKIPATINYRCPDEACDLDYVTEGTREQAVKVAMSNSLGFGGHNSSLVMAAYED